MHLSRLSSTTRTQLVVNGGDGAVGGDGSDIILLNFTNLPAGLAGVTVNADEGADSVSLQTAPTYQ